jgi:hypothetical protein
MPTSERAIRNWPFWAMLDHSPTTSTLHIPLWSCRRINLEAFSVKNFSDTIGKPTRLTASAQRSARAAACHSRRLRTCRRRTQGCLCVSSFNGFSPQTLRNLLYGSGWLCVMHQGARRLWRIKHMQDSIGGGASGRALHAFTERLNPLPHRNSSDGGADDGSDGCIG